MDCAKARRCLIEQAGFDWIPPGNRPVIPSSVQPGLDPLDASLNGDVPASRGVFPSGNDSQ
jgi:hypothetical protein